MSQKLERLQNDVQNDRNSRQRIIDEKMFQLREGIDGKINELKQTILEINEEIKEKISSDGGKPGRRQNWRRGGDWVDDELRRAKQEFKRKYRESFEGENDL